jgi:hypothetical protein
MAELHRASGQAPVRSLRSEDSALAQGPQGVEGEPFLFTQMLAQANTFI